MVVAAGLFLPDPLFWLVATVVGAIAFPFVFGPFLIKATQKFRENPRLVPFDPDEHPAPLIVQEHLDAAEAALWSCGFEALEHVVLPDLVPNVKAIFVLLTRPESNDTAMAVAAFAEGAAPLKNFYVEFATDYADGLELCTNNSTQESAFCPLPHKKIFQCDFLTNPDDLWRFHQRACQEYGTGPKKPSPTREAALDRIREEVRKEFSDQIPVGWLWYDEENEVFRPTWKGACLMTWKQCWPVSALRRAARRMRGKALFHEWDLAKQAH